jgi:hypothetical protein
MNWTPELPTAEGFFFYDFTIWPIRIIASSDELYCYTKEGAVHKLTRERFLGEWCGTVVIPERSNLPMPRVIRNP